MPIQKRNKVIKSLNHLMCGGSIKINDVTFGVDDIPGTGYVFYKIIDGKKVRYDNICFIRLLNALSTLDDNYVTTFESKNKFNDINYKTKTGTTYGSP
jgi:predicted transcriptional regulator